MRPFTTADDAWAALAEQRGMNDGEGLERLGADEELMVAPYFEDAV